MQKYFTLLKLTICWCLISTGLTLYAQTNQQNTKINFEKNKSKNMRYQIDFSSKAVSFSEGEDEATMVILGISPKFQFKFSESLKIDSDISLNLASSRSQSRFIQRSDSSFFLNELALRYKPFSFSTLAVGSLAQDHLESPFLVSGTSFPGSKLNLESNNSAYVFGFKGQYLIPTSSSFDSDRTEKEGTPTLITQGIYGKYKVHNNFKIGAQVNYFQYNDLPAIVAFESKRRGNTVLGDDIGDSRFATKFSGYSQSFYGLASYTRDVEQKVSVNILENENTDPGNNRAQIIETQLILKSKNYDFKPGVSFFYSEPDVAPAYYNSVSFGHNNRTGTKYSFRTKIKKHNLAVELSYTESKIINDTIYQNNLNSYAVLMEMLNVKF